LPFFFFLVDFFLGRGRVTGDAGLSCREPLSDVGDEVADFMRLEAGLSSEVLRLAAAVAWEPDLGSG